MTATPPAVGELLRVRQQLREAGAALAAGRVRQARIGLTAATSLLAGCTAVPKAPLRRAVLACALMRAEDGLMAWAIGVIATRELHWWSKRLSAHRACAARSGR
jgi:hypothetical protein